jgi:hypothetical protein
MPTEADSITDKLGATYPVERTLNRGEIVYHVLPPGRDRAAAMADVVAGLAAFVARAVLDPRRERVSHVTVWPDYRRGIATALYRMIESDLGKPLRPSRMRTKAGREFWKTRAGRADCY